jgi:hypothetical protein
VIQHATLHISLILKLKFNSVAEIEETEQVTVPQQKYSFRFIEYISRLSCIAVIIE